MNARLTHFVYFVGDRLFDVYEKFSQGTVCFKIFMELKSKG